MQSEVRKVLETLRENGMVWWSFLADIDDAERADAARREESRNVTFSDVVSVHCVRCGMQISTTEYAVRCNCGTTIMVHRHNRKVDDGLRKAVAEMIDKWRTCFLPTPVAEIVRDLLTELNAVIATKPESQPATESGPVTEQEVREIVAEKILGVVDSLAFIQKWKEEATAAWPAVPADEHIRAIAAQAVRDAMPDVLDGLAISFEWGVGLERIAEEIHNHANRLRKEKA
jgi:DNA-directed RNA polymerase subunit RPC12/RpoP